MAVRKWVKTGDLRHALAVQLPVSNTLLDKHGQPSPDWETVTARVMAKIETLGGEELEVARKTYAQATHRVTIRFCNGLTTRHRLVARNGSILNIGHIDNVEWLDREPRILVREQV